MRRFLASCLALAALVLAPTVHAQTMVRDSLPIVIKQTYDEIITKYGGSFGRPVYYVGTCTHNFVGVFPDVLTRKGLPGDYAATPTGPLAFFQLRGYVSESNIDLYYRRYVPQGHLALGSNVGSSVSWDVANPQPNYSDCARLRGYYAAEIGKMPPYYAVYSLPDGMPVALFTFDDDNGLTVAFDGSFESKQSREVDASAPGGKRPVVGYAWDFGDGQSGSGPRPSHVYADTGRYDVKLTVTDDDGETDVLTQEVHVKDLGLLVWAERTVGTRDRYAKGDTVSVTTWVQNRSDESAVNVKVQLLHGFVSTFPDSIPAGGRTNASFKRVSNAGQSEVTIPDIPPGERRSFTTLYRVEEYGSYLGSRYYRATAVRSFPAIYTSSVKGELGYIGGPPMNVSGKCELDEACGEEWTVAPPRYDVRITFKAAPPDGLVLREVSAVPSGLIAGPTGLLDVAARHRIRSADLSERFCRSGCVEVEVEVREEGGAPASGVSIRLSADAIPVANGTFGSVTPGQTGNFCDFTTRACGRLLTTTTDANGMVKRTYLVPGVISDVQNDVRVDVLTGSLVMKEEAKTLTVQPTLVRETTLSVGEDSSPGLMSALIVRGLFDNAHKLAQLPATFCKFIGTTLGTAASKAARPVTDFSFLGQMPADALDWGCGKLPEAPFSSVLERGKSFSELLPLAWFLERTQLPGTGLAAIDLGPVPPFARVRDDFTPHVSDAFTAIAQANPASGVLSPLDLLRGQSIEVKIYEVSHLVDARTDAAQTEVSTYGLYVVIGDQAKYVKAGYDGRVWLQEASLLRKRLQTSGSANEGDTQVGAGPPPSRASSAAAASMASGSVSSIAATDTLVAGDIVVLGAGQPSAEAVQIRAVEGTTLHLTTPLRYNHAAGETLYVVGNRALGVPDRPMAFAPYDSASATVRPLLQWTLLAPATKYDVQIGTDTLFTTLVQNHAGLTADSLRLTNLTEGRVYAWRVRATNLLGTGEWSRPRVFTASTPVASEDDGLATTASESTLGVPYPSPTRTTATLRFDLPTAGLVRLSVYDLLGREVAVLVDEERPAGRHEATLSTGSFAPGVYVVRLSTETAVQTQRLVVVR